MGAVITVIANVAYTVYMYFTGRDATTSGQTSTAEHVYGADNPDIPGGNDSSAAAGEKTAKPHNIKVPSPPRHDNTKKPHDIKALSSPGDNDTVKSHDIQAPSSPLDIDNIVASDTGCDLPKSFAECLIKCRVVIVKDLDDLDDILEYLLSSEVISKNEKQLIMAKDTDMDKVRALLDNVDRKGEEACRDLVVALRNTEQIELCTLSDRLKKELDKLPASDVLAIDKYMTVKKEEYKEQIKDKSKIDEEHYGIRVSSTLELDDIFLPGKDSRPHSILMRDDNSMGNTLCFTIMNRFVRGLWKGHQFIFFVLLNQLDDMAQSYSLADLLFDFGKILVEESQKLNMILQLKKRQDKIMFVFDGYNESDEFTRDGSTFSDPSKKAKVGVVLRNLVQGNLFPKSQVLITSSFQPNFFNVDMVVELAGLITDARSKLLCQYILDMGQSGVNEFLNNHPEVENFCCLPGGPILFLGAFFEVKCHDPVPLLSLLAPGGNVLEIEVIAQANRHAVGYFVEQMNSSQGEIGLDTVRLRLTDAVDHAVQKNTVVEVCKMKRLKHLLIDSDDFFEFDVTRPLDMLLMHGSMTRNRVASIVAKSRASTLCLYQTYGDIPESLQLSQNGQEIHLGNMVLHSNTLTSMASTSSESSLRAVTELWYLAETAAAIRQIIQKTPNLQAIGLRLYTTCDADYCKLLRIMLDSSIACLMLHVNPDDIRHMDILKQLLDNVSSSLQELWLVFGSPPRDDVLVDLARWVCQHGLLIRLSLVCGNRDPINVTGFLRQLNKEPHRVHDIYINNEVRSLDGDVVRCFKGDLWQVRKDSEGVFFIPLVYSKYLLTSIPRHVKEVLTRRYVSPCH